MWDLADKSTIVKSNRAFALIFAAAYPLMASVLSLLIVASALFGLVLLLTGRLSMPIHLMVRTISIIFVCYFATGFAVALIHFHPQYSPQTVAKFLPFLAFGPLIALLCLSKAEDLIESLEMGALIGSIFTLFYAIPELLFFRERVWGNAGNPGPYALAVTVMYGVCWLACFRRNKQTNAALSSKPFLFLAGAFAAALCITASGMRTFFPTLIIIPLVLFWIIGSPETIKKRVKNWTGKNWFIGIGVFLVLALIGTGLMKQRIDAFVSSAVSISELGDFDNSLGQRIVMWDFAWQEIATAPVIGQGQQKIEEGMPVFSKQNYGITMHKTHLHNLFATTMVRGGTVEFLITLLVLLGPIVLLFRARNQTKFSRYALGLSSIAVIACGSSSLINIGFGHDIIALTFVTTNCFAVVLSIQSDDPQIQDGTPHTTA